MIKRRDKKDSGGGRTIHIYILLAGAALCLAAAGLMLLASGWAPFAQWYSEHVYPLLVSTTGRFMGLFPFSVAGS